jgi:hypothetical protein
MPAVRELRQRRAGLGREDLDAEPRGCLRNPRFERKRAGPWRREDPTVVERGSANQHVIGDSGRSTTKTLKPFSSTSVVTTGACSHFSGVCAPGAVLRKGSSGVVVNGVTGSPSSAPRRPQPNEHTSAASPTQR